MNKGYIIVQNAIWDDRTYPVFYAGKRGGLANYWCADPADAIVYISESVADYAAVLMRRRNNFYDLRVMYAEAAADLYRQHQFATRRLAQ